MDGESPITIEHTTVNISLRTLFILIAGIAIYLLAVFELKPPIQLIALTFLNSVSILAFASGVIYGRGILRAFCIGCAIAMVVGMVSESGLGLFSAFSFLVIAMSQGSGSDIEWPSGMLIICQHIIILLSGMVMVFFRRLIIQFQEANS